MMNRLLTLAMLCGLLLALPGVATADEMREAFAKSYQYERSQSYADAIKVLIPYQEKNYLVDLRLGWLYYLSGNQANSKAQYQLAIKAAPKAIEPRLGYTLPLLAQERYGEVESVARTILTMDANNYTASLRLAFALRMQGKHGPARELNASLLELYPTDVSFLTEQLLVSVASKQGDIRALCESILTLDPENLTAKQQLAALASAKTPR